MGALGGRLDVGGAPTSHPRPWVGTARPPAYGPPCEDVEGLSTKVMVEVWGFAGDPHSVADSHGNQMVAEKLIG